VRSVRISEDVGDAARDKESGKERVADQEGTRKKQRFLCFVFISASYSLWKHCFVFPKKCYASVIMSQQVLWKS